MIILDTDIGQEICPVTAAPVIEKIPNQPPDLNFLRDIPGPWSEPVIGVSTLNQCELLNPN